MISFFLANIFLAAVAAHLLVELPGAPPNNLSIYSGYLWDGRKGRIHYMLVFQTYKVSFINHKALLIILFKFKAEHPILLKNFNSQVMS